ncbi:ATP-dependent helicase [Shewanella benthica]|nr:ATP-dependent helicase [Shewanella benthica]
MAFEFTNEQFEYINSSIENHVFLEACPGSGKTEIVAAKVAKEIDSWSPLPSGLAVLSFTNSATNELTKRIAKYLPPGRSMFPHFLGTFDSFIYKNIVSPLATELTGFTGDNDDASIRIVEPSGYLGYRSKYQYGGRGNVYAHHFSITGNNKITFDTGDSIQNRTLNSLVLKDWEERDLQNVKKRMLRGGLATYKDIECLALTALTSNNLCHFVELLVKRYPLIMIDECQDLSEEQLTILLILADNGAKLHFIGDLHQAIYGFRDVDPEKISQFVRNNDFIELKLSRNFRSCQNIVNLCSIISGRDHITGNVSWLDSRCLVIQYKKCPTELIGIFEEKCNGFDHNVVVSRGHSILRKFQTSVSKLNNIQKLALAVKLFNPNDMEALNNSMELFSEFISYYLTESCKPNSFNCPQSVDSNLAWRKFLCKSLNHLVSNDLKHMQVSWSDWVKRSKVLVRTLSKQYFCPEDISTVLAPLDEVNLTSPAGFAKNEVNSVLGSTSKSTQSYRMSTIHGSKGETHDVTIVISTAQAGGQPGSHWQSWLNEPNSEAARFAYVASSRPRHYLIWAVKTLKNTERERLEAIGFKIL